MSRKFGLNYMIQHVIPIGFPYRQLWTSEGIPKDKEPISPKKSLLRYPHPVLILLNGLFDLQKPRHFVNRRGISPTDTRGSKKIRTQNSVVVDQEIR